MIDPAAMQGMVDAMQPAVGGPPAPPGPELAPPAMGGPVMAAQPKPEEKKPPLLLPPALAKQLAQGYVDQVRQMSQLVADHTGPPDEFERFPLKEQVKAWRKRDIRQDPILLKEGGASPTEIRDQVYPLRRILLKMAGPRPKDRAVYAARMREESAKLDTIQGATSAL